MTSKYDKSKGTGKRGIDVIVREGGGGEARGILKGGLRRLSLSGVRGLLERWVGVKATLAAFEKRSFPKKLDTLINIAFFLYLTGL